MPDLPPVSVATQDGLAVVTVDAPPLNLFDDGLRAALVDVIEEIERTRPRAALFRFEGRIVTGGVDIGTFETLDGDGAADLFTALVAIARRVCELPFPTVFAAHERCLTWGFELALACDLILAAEPARFGLIEATVGLTPAMGGTQRLAERAGIGRAREFVMTGDLYDAATLHSWGAVDRVLPAEGFDDAARAFARRLADGPTAAHAATKAVLASFASGGGPTCRRGRARHRRTAVRHRRLPRRTGDVPRRGSRPCHVRGTLTTQRYQIGTAPTPGVRSCSRPRESLAIVMRRRPSSR